MEEKVDGKKKKRKMQGVGDGSKAMASRCDRVTIVLNSLQLVLICT